MQYKTTTCACWLCFWVFVPHIRQNTTAIDKRIGDTPNKIFKILLRAKWSNAWTVKKARIVKLDAWVFFSTFRIRKKNALSQALYLIYVCGWNQIWQLSKSDRVWQLENWQLSETVQLKQNALACCSCPSHVKACKFLF